MKTIKGNGFVKFKPADVVAHISFGALLAVDMAIQRKVNDKYYLWVQAAASAPILRREE